MERSDGGQSLVIHRVNYRPTSYKHTPKAAGSGGSEISALFFGLCMYVSITFHLLSSVCSLLPLCSFAALLLSSCFSLPPSLSGDWKHTGSVLTFLDRGVTLYLPVLVVSVCFYFWRTWDVITAESSRTKEAFWPLNDSHLKNTHAHLLTCTDFSSEWRYTATEP